MSRSGRPHQNATILVESNASRYFSQESPPVHAAQYIDDLLAQGRNTFTTEQVVGALGISVPAARAQLTRLKRRGLVASPLRSYLVIVPPEYRRLGCIPAEHFIDALMQVEGQP